MATNLAKYKSDLESLIALANKMRDDLQYRHHEQTGKLTKEEKAKASILTGQFESNYQRWYTEATALIRQLIPDRLDEFVHLYKGDGKRKAIDASSYHIQDWLNGIRAGTDYYGKPRFQDFAGIVMRFQTQVGILESVAARFESSLFDIKQIVQADLLDSEVDAARELNKHGFARAAGAVSGVVIEKHLSQVCSNHNIPVPKKEPSISDLNDLLKNAGVIDIPTWRHIQRLGDLRNLCDHNKHREPTKEEVDELINGAEKITKTIF